MKVKKFLFIVLGMLFGIMCFSNDSYAGFQEWNSLDYDVTVNSDGSMEVVETWDIYISETNTVFKQFKIDSSKYSKITDVEVTQLSPYRMEFEQIYEYQRHVDSDCFYALEIDSSTFEIAWNVGLDDSSATRTYELRYTIEDAVKIYKDCTELYWMFLDTSNQISADNVTGTIRLPEPVEDIENLRVWGHGPLNAIIEKASEDTVVFEVERFKANTMLEVRIVTEENIYLECSNKYNSDKLASILEEEQKWADEANAERDRQKMMWTIIFLIMIVVGIFLLSKIIKYIKTGKELKQKYQDVSQELKYFRDIPDEKNATPARAAYLYYFKNNNSSIGNHISKIFSATILDLALKGILTFEPIDKKEMSIIINRGKCDNIQLSSDEELVYNLIVLASKGKDRVSTKELSKYAKIHYEEVYKSLQTIKDKALSYQYHCRNIDKEKEEISKKWTGKFILYLVLVMIMLFTGIAFFVIPIFIELVICAILCYKNSKTVCILSEKGREEEKQWKGLKNYMDDFSLLKDKEVPDLILWEKFLVYATAFGISKKVIKQLKVVYPEMGNPDYYANHNCAYMYYMCDSRFGDDFIGSFDNMMSSVYNSCASAYSSAHSSGSGGGGGFSGGGGGRRRRWPVAVEDKM